jgi:two-component system response regulator AtoC
MRIDLKETRPPPSPADPETESDSGHSPADSYQLHVVAGGSVSAMKLVLGRSYTFGRSAECDVVMNDPSVSRRHAILDVAESVVLRDLGSHNGTRINGRPIDRGSRVVVPIGAIFQLGTATVVLQRGSPALKREVKGGRPAHRRVVVDAAMVNIYSMVDLVAPTMLAVLILGATGVGKEVFAHEVHDRSPRAGKPFVQLNCAALPESLLEAELFGYEKGAFTGANSAKPGLFESADGGTIFLDEVGDMSLSTQVKVLRFLETGELLRLGSVKPRKVDVRVISATNRDLDEAMAAGTFRADLYFRLNGMTFFIPPLRQRKADIVPLAEMFAEVVAANLGRPTPRLSPGAVQLLEERPWIGNVRELRNVVERAVVLSRVTGGSELPPEYFADAASFTMSVPVPSGDIGGSTTTVNCSMPAGGLESELKELERARVTAALRASRGNQSQAARQLGISRAVLMNRMKVFGLAPTKA